MALTAGDLMALLAAVPASTPVGIFVDSDPQGHEVISGEGYNLREDIFWLRAEAP